MGRTPSLTELGIFSVMWSEHCSYKSSRVWLRELPTKADWVIHGPGENAGVVDIGDGLTAIFKMESHNHPSFIEPYQGAATGVGGILRDVFTMGARPIANLNALRFGRPENPRTKRVVDGVVRGIGGYGNCVGVPTVGGEVNFHAAYDGNPLVNAMTVGIAQKDRIFLSAAAGIGNPVVYVGSKTGRDGIHGATMASAEFDANSEEKRPTVLSPVSQTAGAAPFTLTVNGSKFVSASKVQWSGTALSTTFVSATQLTAAVPAANIAAPGTASVTVSSPTPGGGVSGPLTFTISNPLPVISRVSPTKATAGGAAFTLTVSGTSFETNSTVLWNGSGLRHNVCFQPFADRNHYRCRHRRRRYSGRVGEHPGARRRHFRDSVFYHRESPAGSYSRYRQPACSPVAEASRSP